MGFVCTKIVSVYFSLDNYGLYSQALLIISTACSISTLGMTDAVNFFYNNSSKYKSYTQEQYISTIFGLSTIVGSICGLAILLGAPFLTDYFRNPNLWKVYGWIAFQPLLQNFLPMLQVLYMSAGRAKSIVIINLIISIARLAIFLAASFITRNITTILALTLVSDIIQVAYFTFDLHRHGITIKLKAFQIELCKPILAYAIPMAAFVIINSFMRDTDKWVIGYFASTDELAIYTNCSKLLPFDMLTYSFCLVLIPIITRNIYSNIKLVQGLFGDYLNLGLFTTSILIIPALFLSRDFLLCLYDSKYLPGLAVFIIYLLVDFSRFANVAMLYSLVGKTKQLLYIVLFSFFLNAIGAIVLYKLVGLTGPAIATLICMCISYFFYMHGSRAIINVSVFKLIRVRRWIPIAIECCLIGYICKYAGDTFFYSWSPVLRFILLYGLSLLIVSFINKSEILRIIRSINKAK